MCYHIFAFIAGFVLDLLIGDPHFSIRGLIVMPDIISLKKN